MMQRALQTQPSAVAGDRLLRAVSSIVQALANTASLDETLESVLDTCVFLLDAEGGTIYEHDPRGRVLRFRHVIPPEIKELMPFEAIDDTCGIAGAVFQAQETRIDTEVMSQPEHDARLDECIGAPTRTMITAPLLVRGGRPVGVVQLVNKTDGAFTEEDKVVLEIVSAVASLSIQNARLAEEANRAARLAAMGDIAHDIKNKVAPLSLSAELIMQSLDTCCRPRALASGDAPCVTFVNNMGQITRCFEEAIQDLFFHTKLLSDVARGRSLEPRLEPGDLGAVVYRQAQRHCDEAAQAGVELYAERSKLEWSFDRVLIERLVSNMVQNAIQACARGGKVMVSVAQDGDVVRLTVEDTGRGMTDETLRDVLAGTAESGRSGGTGLGNRICKEIAEAHGGQMEGESAPDLGTRLTAVLVRP